MVGTITNIFPVLNSSKKYRASMYIIRDLPEPVGDSNMARFLLSQLITASN